MAERRMMAIRVIDDDSFLDLPAGARLLYYDLSMRADDDGFITPRKVMRLIGSSQKDLEALVRAGFLIEFESGVVVITHWRQSNTLRKDRYTPTTYSEEFSELAVINGRYERCTRQPLDATDHLPEGEHGNQMATERQPDGNQEETTGCQSVNHDGNQAATERQPAVATGKDRIGKESGEEENVRPDGRDMREEEVGTSVPSVSQTGIARIPSRTAVSEFARCNGLSVDVDEFIRCYSRSGWKIHGEPIRDWRSVFLGWARNGTSERKQHEMDRDRHSVLPDGVYAL